MAVAGFTRVCAKNVTGNNKFWVAEMANITTITLTAGAVSAVGGTGNFHRLQADLDKLSRTENGEGGSSGYKFTHVIKAQFSKPTLALKTLIDSLEAASPCGLAVIMLDANGQAWLIGYNATDLKDRGLRLTKSALDTGMAPGENDKQGWDLEFSCVNSEHALPFDATLSGTILAESATFLTTS